MLRAENLPVLGYTYTHNSRLELPTPGVPGWVLILGVLGVLAVGRGLHERGNGRETIHTGTRSD